MEGVFETERTPVVKTKKMGGYLRDRPFGSRGRLRSCCYRRKRTKKGAVNSGKVAYMDGKGLGVLSQGRFMRIELKIKEN